MLLEIDSRFNANVRLFLPLSKLTYCKSIKLILSTNICINIKDFLRLHIQERYFGDEKIMPLCGFIYKVTISAWTN